jgi:glycosyltransferase involved in cell wall biosynthesis
MYCGSCFRDNALAAELIARGHDVSLVPLYTPTLTDEPNVSSRRVLFGGISVYLQQQSALFRKTPRLIDRLWDSPGLIRAFASRSTSTDPALLGDLTISMLEGERGTLRKEFEKLLDWMRDEPVPDVINLPNSLLIALAVPLRRAVGCPICCTLQGEELFLDGLQPPYRDRAIALIRQQVAHVDRFIAVSDYCAGFMSRLLEIPPARVSVVPLGINMAGYASGPAPQNADPFCVGYFARIAPEKGLHVLADAYVRFRRQVGPQPVRLDAAGYLGRAHEPYFNEVRRTLDKAGLSGEFTYRGALDRSAKLAFLRTLDVLSVPATYDEPKGMFLLEAMAAGVPVVQPRRGAFVEIVERTGGGLLVDPDDPERLAEGLHTLWRDRATAATLSQRAFEGVREHYSVTRSADYLLDVYRALLDRGAASHAGAAASVA